MNDISVKDTTAAEGGMSEYRVRDTGMYRVPSSEDLKNMDKTKKIEKTCEKATAVIDKWRQELIDEKKEKKEMGGIARAFLQESQRTESRFFPKKKVEKE